MFWAACMVGFHAMLRKSNLFAPSSNTFDSTKHCARNHIQYMPWGIQLSLMWTNTIQFKERVVQCPLVKCGGPLCPVTALSHALDLSRDANTVGPMFVYKDKQGRWRPYLYNHFLKQLKKLLLAIGLDSKKYAGHSLRRGGATWAMRCGVPGEVIKSMGDWRSTAYLQYLDINCSLKVKYALQMMQHLPK